MSFPNKAERKRCWDSRDRYWECLDSNNDDNKCTEFRKTYEDSCPAQWCFNCWNLKHGTCGKFRFQRQCQKHVKHFDRKRNYLKFKDKIQNEGYEPIETRDAQA